MQKILRPAMARGAVTASGLVVFLSGVNAAFLDTGWGNITEFLLGVAFAGASLGVCFLLAIILLRTTRFMDVTSAAILLASLGAVWILFENSPGNLLRGLLDRESNFLPPAPEAYSLPSLLLFVLCVFGVATVLHSLSRWREEGVDLLQRYALLAASVVLVLLCFDVLGGILRSGVDPFPNDGAVPLALEAPAGLENPGAFGKFSVERLTYGAGVNKRRPEFGKRRSIESRVVDARPLLPEWKNFKQQMRENYWGFGLDAAPLNGLVWAPEGEGRFPLVLVVHGNHGMEDYSDAGYAYLGELLASRGFIVVSVDQNYINGSWSGDFRGKEMAARGWLLLEHLALWRDWRGMDGHPLGGRVDMDRIALIGHSRGGEAVSIAAAFNELPRFPDDGTVSFDYGFKLTSLIAIAQVDQRYHRRVQLSDINFFTIHGSYDSDEPAYHGLRQMNRIRFTEAPDSGFIKAGAYLHGANHGQFNTGWGRHDYGFPGASRLNTAPIIPGTEQRDAARVYISAFLEATLHEQHAFRAFLKDPRVGANWLPRQSFVAQYQDSSFVPLADFEEDLNLTTASLPDSMLAASGLSVWREEPLLHRDRRLQGSQALYVGWEKPGASLSLELASPVDMRKKAVALDVSADPKNLGQADKTPTIAGFSLEAEDATGQRARVSADAVAQLVPPVRVQYLKSAAANKSSYNALWEPVLQHVEFSAATFAAKNPDFDAAAVVALHLHFDGADEGALIFDHWGLTDSGIIGKVPRS